MMHVSMYIFVMTIYGIHNFTLQFLFVLDWDLILTKKQFDDRKLKANIQQNV